MMPPSRVLSSEEVRALRTELSGGGTPTVWFTSSAVGVPEGRSGKVIGLDDADEGDFIQVRPAGSKDVLSFSAAEVTLEKPPRKRKQPSQGKQSPQGKADTVSEKAPESANRSTRAESRARASTPSTVTPSKAGSSQQSGTSQRSETGQRSGGPKKSEDSVGNSTASPKRASQTGSGEKTTASTKTTRRKPKQPDTATVTVTADESGQWSVEVITGKKRLLKPMSVSASAVAQAAKALHDDVAEAVEPVVEAARDKQRERVEQLQQELAEAQRKLDDLG